MTRQNAQFTLKKLIQTCNNSESPLWEAAWREFISRYKMSIYGFVSFRCKQWNVSRLNRQLSEVINDIAAEVFIIIYKSLSQFREIENEKKLQFWISTICNRAASRHLQKQFVSSVTDADLEDFQDFIKGIDFESRWELYESLVNDFRDLDKKNRTNLERDINLFLLYTWSDFSADMLKAHPCYSDMGDRVVDNVVNRMRNYLKSEK